MVKSMQDQGSTCCKETFVFSLVSELPAIFHGHNICQHLSSITDSTDSCCIGLQLIVFIINIVFFINCFIFKCQKIVTNVRHNFLEPKAQIFC